jgi:hypothetical protein
MAHQSGVCDIFLLEKKTKQAKETIEKYNYYNNNIKWN